MEVADGNEMLSAPKQYRSSPIVPLHVLDLEVSLLRCSQQSRNSQLSPIDVLSMSVTTLVDVNGGSRLNLSTDESAGGSFIAGYQRDASVLCWSNIDLEEKFFCGNSSGSSSRNRTHALFTLYTWESRFRRLLHVVGPFTEYAKSCSLTRLKITQKHVRTCLRCASRTHATHLCSHPWNKSLSWESE